MNAQWWTASGAGVALLVAGCSGHTVADRSVTISAIEPEAAAVPQPAANDAAPPLPATPTTAPRPSAQLPQFAPVDESLIPVPTLVPPPPTVLSAPPAVVYRNPSPAVAPPPAIPQQPVPNTTAVAPASPSAAPANPPASSAISPVPVPAPAAIASPPSVAAAPLPNPVSAPGDLASQIEVSGVIQVGGRTSAIIAVPNESSSRYVSVGDNLANGRIQVKRIEVGADQEPVVVLEQDGVEVYRSVGNL
ncbi:hypothetical protein IQ268_13040 [Oculatella sp. LEGE 06141]|uniref:hypothetical protein n=1 Tax=Oculatella sp. LEGE 06141 TaxID=1828648 RepID=UPI00188277A5|nr:hypothetical protein [Oculatella sp. LEGE 06141]MBE9179489.1 hypothetical protein [Oculatella sp. LEGE 06141]